VPSGDLQALRRSRQSISARFPGQRLRFNQRPHALLEEERIALRARDQELLQRRQARITTKQRFEKFLGARRRQGVEAQLPVVGLAAPEVLVLRPVVDEYQHRCRRQALDELLQHVLRLAVDPVQILEDHDEWLHVTLAEQQMFHSVERALSPLRRLETVPLLILDRYIEDGEQRRQGRLQRAVQ